MEIFTSGFWKDRWSYKHKENTMTSNTRHIGIQNKCSHTAVLIQRDGEGEAGAFALLADGRNRAAHRLDHTLGHRKDQDSRRRTCAYGVAGELEDALELLRRYAKAGVGHGELEEMTPCRKGCRPRAKALSRPCRPW